MFTVLRTARYVSTQWCKEWIRTMTIGRSTIRWWSSALRSGTVALLSVGFDTPEYAAFHARLLPGRVCGFGAPLEESPTRGRARVHTEWILHTSYSYQL
jgi:hypothetical protein